MRIEQDASLYASILAPEETVRHDLAEGRHSWVQVASGEVDLNGVRLKAGDGAAVSDERILTLTGVSAAEFLVFDLN